MKLIADSGSTKTDWVLISNHQVVARRQTRGINPVLQTDSEILSELDAERLTADIGRGLSSVPGGRVEHLCFYGAGCRDDQTERMQGLLAGVFGIFGVGVAQVEVQSDLVGAARAVCGTSEGIAAILGTGANSGLYDGRRIVQNTPALGYILGDEGSGAVLGRRFLNALFKGQLPENLRDAFLRQSKMSLSDIIHRVYRQPMANRWLASLSPFISSQLDCPGVRQLVVGNFRDFFRCNVRPYARPDLPVGAVGSIAFHYRAQLAEAADAEGFRLGSVVQSPLEGLISYHAQGR